MKRFIIGFGWLVAACVAVAGMGTSNEFRVDTRTGVRTAAATEKIQYSTAWATNLTAAQQGEAKAVVKIDGVPVELANVSGSFDWTAPSDIGIYRFTHQIFTNGVQVGETLNAAFKVAGELNIVNVKARQRYPWNGLVDVDCDIVGDPEKAYCVTLTAKDVGGSTNLPVRTAWQVGGSVTNGEFLAGPGHYRFVWNADADIANDIDYPSVSVGLKAVGGETVGYKRVLTISTDGYTSDETLSGVPVLVRLSSDIEGFDYSDFAASDTGADMIFTDMDETTTYPYEIDEWHKDGESLVWVKLPELKKGTKFKCAYGNAQYGTMAAHSVWRDYAGVWHMNEDSGTAFDSTAHGLDASPSCGSGGSASTLAQMVAYENGACGRARVNATAFVDKGNYLSVPSYDALALGASFVASGWFNGHAVPGCPRPLSRKAVYTSSNGWETQFDTDKADYGGARGGSSTIVKADIPSAENGWVYIAYAFAGNQVSIYTNGALSASGEITPATDNGLPLSFGNNSDGSEKSWHGQYDEIRLIGGTLSPTRVKADYDMIANRNFCTYSAVTNGPGVVAKEAAK